MFSTHQRLSREEILREAGATPDELAAFERGGLLRPVTKRFPSWRRSDPYYTPEQIEILRWLLQGRRARERAQSLCVGGTLEARERGATPGSAH